VCVCSLPVPFAIQFIASNYKGFFEVVNIHFSWYRVNLAVVDLLTLDIYHMRGETMPKKRKKKRPRMSEQKVSVGDKVNFKGG